MEREQKPDASIRVNDFDIMVFRRGRGVEIVVEKEGLEMGFFGLSGVVVNQQEKSETSVATPASLPTLSPEPVSPAEAKKEPSQPVKIEGLIAEIEGLGQTPTTGDPVFRFRVKVVNPQTQLEETKQIAAFRQIGLKLHELANSTDPNINFQPGRPISMMAWDHTATTGSYYPSSVNYLNLPPITNPKTQKRG